MAEELGKEMSQIGEILEQDWRKVEKDWSRVRDRFEKGKRKFSAGPELLQSRIGEIYVRSVWSRVRTESENG